MNSELKQLLELQEIDKVLDQMHLDLTMLPLQIEEKCSSIKQGQESMGEKKKKLVAFQLARKEREVELASQEEKIRKHETELNAVNSNEAYRALLSEIDNVRKQKGTVEDEILNLLEETDQENSALKMLESETRDGQQKLESEIKEIEERIKKTTADLEIESKKRESFAVQVPQELLKNYNYIREKKKGIAIVSIVGDSCAGCNTILTQSMVNEAKKGKNLIICDSCSRILCISESEMPAPILQQQ